MRAIPLLMLMALASGCASWPQAGTVEAGSVSRPAPQTAPTPAPGGPASAPAEPGPGTAEPEPKPARPWYHPAGQALIAQARQQAAAGDPAAAGSTLERALRVDPDNPWIWIELARLRYAEGDASGGQSMARKALSLSGADREAAATAGRLVSGAGP